MEKNSEMKSGKSSENQPYPDWDVARNVQPLVWRKAQHLGDRGTEWLEQLPKMIADLEQRWSIIAGDPLSGGTTSYVCRAVTRDGADAVLKLSLPDEGFQDSVRLLDAADGDGYVRLLAHDRERHAVLLEALGAPMNTLDLTPDQQLRALGRTLRRAWQVPR